MSFEEIKKNYEQSFKEEFEAKSKIVNLLNDLRNVIDPNLIPLKYSYDENIILFKISMDYLLYLERYCVINNLENSLKHLSCFAFHALFLIQMISI